MDEKCVIDNKKFWKTVKPFLSDKTMVDDKITLVENDEIITDDLKIAETFNNFFSEIVPNLNITTNSEILTDTSLIDDPVLKAIKKYEKHPSIKMIKEKMEQTKTFTLKNPVGLKSRKIFATLIYQKHVKKMIFQPKLSRKTVKFLLNL